jgi:hypothetical protein
MKIRPSARRLCASATYLLRKVSIEVCLPSRAILRKRALAREKTFIHLGEHKKQTMRQAA